MPIPRTSGHSVISLLEVVLRPMGTDGVHARTALFETVLAHLSAFITRHREPGTETFTFPPVMSRAQLEASGYLKSFPHLLGCVSGLHGDEADVQALVGGRMNGSAWTEALAATDVVLTPAACYPLYPLVAANGAVPGHGAFFDVESYCFRREVSTEPGRLQSFRMREFVCIGSPRAAQEFRRRLLERAESMMLDLALPYRIASASDPFFGRVGRIMALDQVERALKFELLVPLAPEEPPVACMSFNYHQDHFGKTWRLRTDDGAEAHTACVAFGVERLCIALFALYGLEPREWPASTRAALSI